MADSELGQLKALLNTGYDRWPWWNFDDLFTANLPNLPDNLRTLYELLGAAILDEQALPALGQNELWQQIEARPK